MADIKALAAKELIRLNAELEQCEKIISVSPAGHLKCSRRADRRSYYVVSSQSGRRKARYIRTGDIELAEGLAMRDHCLRKRNILNDDLDLLKKFLNGYDPFPDATASKQGNPDHLILIKDRLSFRGAFAKDWQTAEYAKNPVRPEGLKYRTMSGVKVRSKSEVIIADQLFGRGVPFRYESLVTINGQDLYPDFTIYNTETAEIVIWEHFGLMSDEAYRLNAFKKISAYAGGGFKLDKNLIATFEWHEAPLDTSFVALLIDHYFC